MSDTLIAFGTTVLTALGGTVLWFLVRLIDENKEQHREFNNDIRKLADDLSNVRSELTKLGLVAPTTDKSIKSEVKAVRKEVGEVKKKVEQVESNFYEPKQIGGMIIYESIPEFLKKISDKTDVHEVNFNKIAKVLKGHNRAIVKINGEIIEIKQIVIKR